VGAIFKTLKITRQRYCVAAVLLILLVQYGCSSLLLDQALGSPGTISIVLNRSGASWDGYYIYAEEVTAAQWLHSQGVRSGEVATDGDATPLGLAGFQGSFAPFGENMTGYVYLCYANLLGNFPFSTALPNGHVTQYGWTTGVQYSSLVSGKSKIYDNGKAVIYG